MRKLITLSDAQNDAVQRVMTETLQTSLGGLLVFLVLHYEQTKKRPQGRPRTTQEDEDDGALYYTPDYPENANKYTYPELQSWYEYDERRGKMPPREELKRAD